jgi:hypothetical protein
MGIKYNLYEYVGYYSLVRVIEIEPPIKGKIAELVWCDIGYDITYYEPLIFNSLIALKCKLFPFASEGRKLLATGLRAEYWPYLISARLDAYRALTHKTIDKGSLLFTNFTLFEEAVGKTLTKIIFGIVS